MQTRPLHLTNRREEGQMSPRDSIYSTHNIPTRDKEPSPLLRSSQLWPRYDQGGGGMQHAGPHQAKASARMAARGLMLRYLPPRQMPWKPVSKRPPGAQGPVKFPPSMSTAGLPGSEGAGQWGLLPCPHPADRGGKYK